MFRPTAAFAVLVATLIGCSKSNDPTPPGGPGEESSNAAYELKFPALQKGDKHEIVKARNATETIQTPNSTQTTKDEFRYEYTETIVDMAANDPLPTKATRVYKTAQKTDAKGDMKSTSYVGKTVTIEKDFKSHKFTAGGKSLPTNEQIELGLDFDLGQWKLERVFPKHEVKVGDQWSVDFAALKNGPGGKAAGVPSLFDTEKSKVTGKLVRAYQKDGRQWGVIEMKWALVFRGATKGSLDVDETYDIVIDGSAHAGMVRMTTKSTREHRDMLGTDVLTTVEGTEEQSLTPVK